MITIIACSRHVYILFFAHIPFVVNHTINATPTERLQHYTFCWFVAVPSSKYFLLLLMRNLLLIKICALGNLWNELSKGWYPIKCLASPWKQTCQVVLRSQSQSGMCAKLRTVAASNDRDHPTRSLFYCLFVPRIYRCCSSRTFRSLWTVHSA